jgi:hypothetical protein
LHEAVVSQNRIELRSGRIAVVIVEQATEPLAPEHPSVLVRRRRPALEQRVVETLVVPLAVVVDEVLTDGAADVLLPAARSGPDIRS